MHLNAEVVIVFEGTVDSTGLRFMVRQSFLPHEIKWCVPSNGVTSIDIINTTLCACTNRGHVFQRVIYQAKPGEFQHKVDLARFHEIVPQEVIEGKGMLNNEQMSQLVLQQPQRTVPYPALTENTLVLSDRVVITEGSDGVPRLVFRCKLFLDKVNIA